MSRRSSIPPRFNAMLFAAALAVVQVCTGFTPALADARNLPGATAAAGCCGGTPAPDCSTAQESAGVLGNCAPYCLTRQDAAKSAPALPAPSAFTRASPSLNGRVTFPPQLPRLTAAALPANGVPLIYLLQRLLN